MGYDVFKECIPVVPAQHYFMGGVKVDHESRSSMENLYVVGEAACNGVHGKNRLASNSLLESLVFARRAAQDMAEHDLKNASPQNTSEIADYLASHVDFPTPYQDIQTLAETYHHLATQAITLGQNQKAERNFYMYDQVTLGLNVDPFILSALKEDITSEDVSTNSVMPDSTPGVVDLICKEDGIICGLQVFERVSHFWIHPPELNSM